MKIGVYSDPAAFVENVRADLESSEAANSLMLGICGQLVHTPWRYYSTPCLRTVTDEDSLVLAALMTPPHNMILYGRPGDIDDGTRALIGSLVGEEWVIPGVLGPATVATGFAEKWSQATGEEHHIEQRLRAYELREATSPPPARGRLRVATEADLELVAGWQFAFHVDVFGAANREDVEQGLEGRIYAGDVVLWQDERPVSMAMKTRPTRHGISVSAVYTPPELRRRGYATACVGALSRMLLESGWEHCTLFADVANETANRVYLGIGYRPVCDYNEYAFVKEGQAPGKEDSRSTAPPPDGRHLPGD